MFEKHRVAPVLRHLTDAQLLDGLARGLVVKRGSYLVPTVSGGDDLAATLARIEELMRKAQERQAQGDSTADADLATLQGQKAQIEEAIKALGGAADPKPAPAGDQKSAEEQLAELQREARLREQAATISTAIVKQVRQEQADEAKLLTELVQKTVAETLGHSSVDEAVKAALGGMRAGSRFVAPGADAEALKAIANGQVLEHGTWHAQPTNQQVDKQLERLVESKSLVAFMASAKAVRHGYATPAQRIFVLSGGTGDAKALAEGTPSAGGYLVRPEWMPDILGLLRGSAVVRQAGPRIQPFNKLMSQTALSTGATAYYTAENAAIPKSEQTFAETPLLTPHNLTGLVPVSNYLLGDDQIGGGAEEIVRQDLIVVMALREDLAFLRGDGTGGSPTGFRSMAGITLDPLGASPANGFLPTLSQLRKMIAVFRTQNATNIRPAWFFNPAFLSYLEGLTDSLGRFLVDTTLLQYNPAAAPGGDSGNVMSGTLMGLPFYATNQLPANLTQGSASNATDIYLVNMTEAIVGVNQELEIDLSSEASYTPDGGTTWINAFQNNQTLFRAVLRHDIAHRRPQQVLVQRGVLV